MNQDLSELLDELNRAINEALWSSENVLNALAELEEKVGDFRISLDLLLPDAKALKPDMPAEPETAGYDEQFLKTLKIEP